MTAMPPAALAALIHGKLPEIKLTENAPMSAFTTLRLGGNADVLAEPASAEEVRSLLELLNTQNIPVTVIGRGSNLLVKDGGIRGVVLRIGPMMKNITIHDDTIEAEAGASLAALAAFAAEHSLTGLEFAGGIPGAAGGAVTMNAGAYGGQMSDVVDTVSGFDLAGRPFLYSAKNMAFDYRTSRLQIEEKIVTSVTFRLAEGNADEILEKMSANNRARAEKQPLDMPSAGSTFRRPKNGYAAALIDQCGLKGCSIGGAQVSEKHAGFLVNRGGTAKDFLALIDHVHDTVLDQTGIELEKEVCVLGEDA